MNETVRNKIKKIRDREIQATESFLRKFERGDFSGKTKEEIAQISLMIEPDGDLLQLPCEIGNWCNGRERISILQLLMYQPVVFVDFGAWNENEFIEIYGVNARQMANLAEKKRVILSLYHYESYQRELKKDPDSSPGYERDACRHLDPLLFSPHTRIASIRRPSLLKAIGVNVENAENWHKLFTKAVNDASEDQRIAATFHSDAGGALQVLSHNYAYVRSIGFEHPAIKDWIESLENKGEISIDNLPGIAKELNGIKTRLSSPFTAAHGGIYVMSKRNYRNVIQASNVLHVSPDQLANTMENKYEKGLKNEKDKLRQAVELVARLGLDRKFAELTTVNRKIRFAWPPNDKQFEHYLLFLEKIEETRNKLSTFYHELSSEGKTRNANSWHELLRILYNLENEASLLTKLIKTIPAVGAGSFIILGGFFPDIFPPSTSTRSALGIAGIGAGTIVANRIEQRRRVKKPGSRFALVQTWAELREAS